jgi:hypothetical protein
MRDTPVANLIRLPLLWHTFNTHMAGTQRAHILIPGDLLREIDALVGPRGRSAFLLETARQEVQRRKLLRFLESEDPAWKDQGHPELARGAAAWVQQLRKQSEDRPRQRTRPKPAKRK